MSIKDKVAKIKNLEAEKLSLLAEVKELKEMADAKANALADEIESLRDDIQSVKALMETEKMQPPPNDILEEKPMEIENPQPPTDRLKEKNVTEVKELVEKTLDASNKLGCQVFASSPFDQYFDDWLVNLRLVVSEFESNSPIAVDEQFVKDRSQIFQDIECVLAQKKVEELKIREVTKSLADHNHLLVEADKEYAEKSRAMSLKKDLETEPLLYRIRELMSDIRIQEDTKNKMFKKRTADKLAQAKKDLQSAENELEAIQSRFNGEQDKLHDKYEKKKQDLTSQVESLHKELEQLETDTSIEARQAAANALADAVNALVQRNPLIA
jgi:DNA repair exonuclease SbcCD ATPase subunit